MKKLAGLLVTCLFLLTSGQSLWASPDLITELREAFGISSVEATDEQLKQFLKDRTNRSFVESMLKQIKHGQQLQYFLNNQTHELPNMSKEALKYLGKKFIIDLLKLIGDRADIFWLSTGSQLIGILSTISSGVSIFIRFSDALVAFDSRVMLNEYINGREQGQSPQFVFQDLYNVFQPVIDKIICFKIPFKCLKQGGVTEEDKQNFATYLEFSYQSWKLFNDQERRNDVKRYILANINHPPIANAGPDQTVLVAPSFNLMAVALQILMAIQSRAIAGTFSLERTLLNVFLNPLEILLNPQYNPDEKEGALLSLWSAMESSTAPLIR
jgi:hypothetical protein